jgi:VanZ family protein
LIKALDSFTFAAVKNFLQASWLRSPVTAVLYWLFITVLFMLPGSALPTTNWLSDIHFDKWLHVGFFLGLVFLLLSAFSIVQRPKWKGIGIALAYGLAIEFIQHYFVANRAFDIYDWLADAAGSLVGGWLWSWVYKKNKPL